MGCKSSKNKDDASQPTKGKPDQNGVTQSSVKDSKGGAASGKGKSGSGGPPQKYDRFEYSESLLENSHFMKATGPDPSKEAFEELKKEYIEMKSQGKKDKAYFELALAVGTIGLLNSENKEEEYIKSEFIDKILKPIIGLGKELYGENSPAVAEVYDCMGIQSEPSKGLCKVQIEALKEAVKIKESYQEGPELGRTYSYLASNLCILEEREEMSKMAQKAIPLLLDHLEEYLPEFAIAATFVDEHSKLDNKFVDTLKMSLPKLQIGKNKLRLNDYQNTRSFVKIIVSKLKSVLLESIDKIEHEGIIFKNEEATN